jgi:hypothetical protein
MSHPIPVLMQEADATRRNNHESNQSYCFQQHSSPPDVMPIDA